MAFYLGCRVRILVKWWEMAPEENKKFQKKNSVIMKIALLKQNDIFLLAITKCHIPFILTFIYNIYVQTPTRRKNISQPLEQYDAAPGITALLMAYKTKKGKILRKKHLL